MTEAVEVAVMDAVKEERIEVGSGIGSTLDVFIASTGSIIMVTVIKYRRTDCTGNRG